MGPGAGAGTGGVAARDALPHGLAPSFLDGESLGAGRMLPPSSLGSVARPGCPRTTRPVPASAYLPIALGLVFALFFGGGGYALFVFFSLFVFVFVASTYP